MAEIPGVLKVTVAPPTEDTKSTETKVEPIKLTNPLRSTSIEVIVGRAVTIFTGLSGSVALLMFMYGGVMWLTSGGNAERVERGKKIFTWATIGLVIIFGAYAILSAIFGAIGAT